MPFSKWHKAGKSQPLWLTAQPFAHRGLHDGRRGVIENSPSAFHAALAENFGIELDVQLTADGQAIVFHDRELNRLVGGQGRVGGMTADALRMRVLKGSQDHIPTLDETLELVAGQVPILVEIKSRPRETGLLEQAVARSLKNYHGAVAIMSFNPESVAWFRDHSPHTIRGFVASTRYPKELGWRLSTAAGQMTAANRIKPDFVAYDIRSLPNTFTRRVRTAELPLLTWTVRSDTDHAKARSHTDNIIFERL